MLITEKNLILSKDTTTEKVLACLHRYRVILQDIVRNKCWNNMWWAHRLDQAYAQLEQAGVAWDREHADQCKPEVSISPTPERASIRRCPQCG